MKRRKIRRNPPTKLDFSMAKAGDKYIGVFELDKGNGESDIWTVIKRGRVFLIGTPTNTGLLSDYYYKMDTGESEQNALQEINSDLEVLAQDGEKYMSLVKRIPRKISPNRRRGLRRNPAKRDFYGDVYIGKKKVDTVFVRSISEGSKRERELDVMDELLSMPNSYELAWVRKPNGLYDVRKGFRVRET
jgi:hypothetical protein